MLQISTAIRTASVDGIERRSLHCGLLVLVIVAGAMLRVYDLGAESCWIDRRELENRSGASESCSPLNRAAAQRV
jgi:hypothetical protein